MGPWFWIVACFLFGATTGSFLNVVIWRLPTDRSLLWPGSHCTSCYTPIPWYWNLPIIGWFLLRGRSACCGQRIGSRYWIIELVTALLFVGVFLADFVWPIRSMGTVGTITERLAAHWPVFALHLYLFAALLAASMIDLEHTIIPASITNIGIGLALLVSLWRPETQPSPLPFADSLPNLASLTDSVIGFAAGFGICWLTRFLGTLAFKKEALGRGDLHLMGMVGAVLGWEVAILGFFIGPFFGLAMVIVGQVIDRSGERRIHIPYGPGLSLGSAAAWLAAPHMATYLGIGV